MKVEPLAKLVSKIRLGDTDTFYTYSLSYNKRKWLNICYFRFNLKNISVHWATNKL